jgi:hypothetical protein
VYASDVNDALTGVIYGGVLIAFMWVLPEGAAGLVNRVRGLAARRRERREWASDGTVAGPAPRVPAGKA